MTKIGIKIADARAEGRSMSAMILTSTELVVLVAMLGGLVRKRSLRMAAVPLRTRS